MSSEGNKSDGQIAIRDTQNFSAVNDLIIYQFHKPTNTFHI
jgi:hypothetical protein